MINTIKTLELDLSSLPEESTTRDFAVVGDTGSGFTMEVKNVAGEFYNFVSKVFQVAKAGLSDKVITGGGFRGNIVFPTVETNDQYDIFLFATPITTRHAEYAEARFGDGSLDINSTSGSNSLLIKKVVYQYTDVVLTLSPYSASGNVEVGSIVIDSVTAPMGSATLKVAFTTSFAVSTATKSYSIIKQPTPNDVISFVAPTVSPIEDGGALQIEGEDIYPNITGSDTTNGIVSGESIITFDTAVANTMSVGDRITGDGIPSTSTVTVLELTSTYACTVSESVSIGDRTTISFYNQMNYRWKVDNFVDIIKTGMIVVPNINITSGSSIGDYKTTITNFADTEQEEVIITREIPGVDKLSSLPVITNGLVASQAGAVIFDKQQALALAGNSIKVGGYGVKEVYRMYGYHIALSDLAITLGTVTTTTTSSVSNSTSVPVAERGGILDTISSASGIGIDPASIDPTVSSGANSESGAGTIVLSAPQTIESGATITFYNAGTTATISGDIEITKVGNASQTIRFDVDQLLSIA